MVLHLFEKHTLMATERQIEANRLNAQKSTGPRTEEGKALSCRNALTHGLTAITMPADDAEAVQKRTSEFTELFPPTNEWEFQLVTTMAREEIRLERLRVQEQAHCDLLARRASLCWDEDRRLVAEKLFTSLPRRPSLVSRQLRQTRQGCDLLLERWQMLDGLLETKGEWTPAQRSLALDMLGVDPALRDARTVLDPPPGNDDPVAHQRYIVELQIERLERFQASCLENLDRAEKTVAELGAAPPDPIMKLYRRYEAAARRQFRWAHDQLLQIPAPRRCRRPRLHHPPPSRRPFAPQSTPSSPVSHRPAPSPSRPRPRTTAARASPTRPSPRALPSAAERIEPSVPVPRRYCAQAAPKNANFTTEITETDTKTRES